MSNPFEDVTCDDILSAPPIKEVSGDDICGLKKDVEQMHQDMIKGKLRGIGFAGGPLEGERFCAGFDGEEPVKKQICLPVKQVFHLGVECDVAYYWWDCIKRVYVFDRMGRKTFTKEDFDK